MTRILSLAIERWCYRPARLPAISVVSRGLGAEVARHYPGVPVAPIGETRRSGGPLPRLWVVGSENTNAFAALAERCAVADRVEFVGRRRADECELLVPRTPSAVATALLELMAYPERRAAMGELARGRTAADTRADAVENVLQLQKRLATAVRSASP